MMREDQGDLHEADAVQEVDVKRRRHRIPMPAAVRHVLARAHHGGVVECTAMGPGAE